MSLVDDLTAARSQARTAADALITRAAEEQRDLTADELSEYSSHLGEEREAADRIEQLNADAIEELRAAVARTPETRAELGSLLLRAIDESSGAGAAFTPTEFATSFFDALTPQSVGLASGFTVVTTTRDSLSVPRWLSDTTTNYVAEGQPITSTDADADSVVATPYKFAGLQTISNEALADSSPSLGAQIAAGLTRSMALTLDNQFFNGSPVAITGLMENPDVQHLTGVAIPDDLDDIADALEALETANATPTAIYMHPTMWGHYRKVKETVDSVKPLLQDSAGSGSQAIQRSIYGTPVWVSSQLDPTAIIVADAAQVVVVRREDVRVETDSSRLFNSDQSEIRAIARVDMVTPNPLAIAVLWGAS